MKYKVIKIIWSPGLFEASSFKDVYPKFEKMVNAEIKSGWRPVGGISVSAGSTLLQAMIKKEK